MARFLSHEWFEEVNLAAAGARPEEGPAEAITIRQVITDSPEGSLEYTVVVSASGLELRRGEVPDPDVTITEDYRTAVALAKGQVTAGEALAAGRIRVSGDTSSLLAGQRRLEALGGALADVSGRTTY